MIRRSIDRHVDTEQDAAWRRARKEVIAQVACELVSTTITAETAVSVLAWQDARITALMKERGL